MIKKGFIIFSLFSLATCSGNLVITDNNYQQENESIYLIPNDQNSIDPNSKNIINYIMTSS